MHTDEELMTKIRVYPAFICGSFFNHRWTQINTDEDLTNKIRVYLCLSVV